MEKLRIANCEFLATGHRSVGRLAASLDCQRRHSSRPFTRPRLVAAQFTLRYSQLDPQRGFTLIELLVVISLISILAAMGMVQHKNSVRHTQEAVLQTDLFHMRDAIDQYYADKGKYPASLDALVSEGYLRKIPEDPITKSADSWITEPAEPDPNNPTAEPGIYNVKSGAQGQALDGKNYSDM
jgi:general secretion pathway protein G